MSIPGYFDPELKSAGGKETHEYVDGGLLNNLPVDLVKAMGADIVIAVYLASDPYDPNKPHTAVDVLSRSVSAVMAANERHNIEMADMLVSVNLSGYSIEDFSKAQEIIKRGVEGAEKRQTLLAKFALDDSSWLAYMQRRESRRKTLAPAPQFVAIEGLEGSDGKGGRDAALADDLRSYFADQIGKPLDPPWVEAQIRKIMGMGVFAYISYAAIERDGQPGLAIYVQRSNARPPTLQPAIGIDGSDYLNPRFSVAARLTVSDFGGFRSELRTDLMVGSTYGVRGEYFHPFSPLSNWFIAPRVFAENRPVEFYHRSRVVALDREHNSGGGLDLGYSIANTGEVRLGYEASYLSTSFRVGDASAFPILAGRYGAAHLSYTYDRLDDEIVPHAGLLAHGDLRWVDANPGSTGHLPVLDVKSTFFQPVGARNTGFVSMEGGTIFNTRNAGIPFFFLGGPQRLSAYGMNELFGNQYFLGRFGFLKQLNAPAPFTDGRVYLFADYEVAKMYGVKDATVLPMDASAGVLVRTLVGPLFAGGSVGDGGYRKWYFQLGRFF
jgi:NTE family protein